MDVEEPSGLLAVMAMEADTRMLVQQSCFTIHSDNKSLERLGLDSKCYLKGVIPAKSVKPLARELRLVGLRRGYIFPDLDNIAKEMRASYPPKWAADPSVHADDPDNEILY